MRAVLDSGVFVRALINPKGPWGRLLSDHADEYAIVLSPAMVWEVLDALHVPELRERFPRIAKLPRVDWLLETFEEAEVVEPRKRLEVCRDPSDDKLFECAVAGRAGYIVSEDEDVLAVGEYEGVRTLTAGEFLALVDKGGR